MKITEFTFVDLFAGKGTSHLSRVHKQPNRIYCVNGTHPTLSSQEPSGRFWIKLQDDRVRKLTILECFRLMGFCDSFKKIDPTPYLYKQIGNAVCVPMIQQIGEWVLQSFEKQKIYDAIQHKEAI